MYTRYLKRFFDLLVALVLFLGLLPLLMLVTLVLAINNGGQPFFVQPRPGKNGKIFHLIKFKTMHDGTDISGRLLPDAERLTVLGAFVRKTSLDELPQLLNVIKGDMSLVGPRPLLIEYLPLYNERQKKRHDVRPGITGWAQVNGRNALSWEQKFENDVWYVEHLSFLLDLKIIGLTAFKVWQQEGINAPGYLTTEKFKGNKQVI